ncbi:MAG: ABC transporter substrate-binding protein [Planctomycetota bacterium]|nr:MAG: ABC transporter substrate-binding protein [Planctomycetota bacterium]
MLAAALALLPAGSRAGLAAERIQVVCTLPHLASLVRELGGDRVQVRALAAATLNPHYVVPTPGLMAAVAEADLFVEIGAGLELWSERVLQGARNPRVRPGQPGYVAAYQGVPMEQVPAVLSRAYGDLHPLGNPHIWLDPLNVKVMAANIATGLERVDPEGGALYQANLQRLQRRLDEAYFGAELIQLLGIELLERLRRSGRLFEFLEQRQFRGAPLAQRAGGWLGRMWPYRRSRFVAYHRQWVYFARAFDLEEFGQLEPKPGIPPTPGHLEQLEAAAKAAGVRVVLCAPYHDFGQAEAFARRIGARAVRAPTEPGIEGIEDYFGLMDELTRRYAAAAQAAD